MNQTVSVVMCFHNARKWLPTAIESIHNQNIKAELILVSDASTDGSLEIAANAGARVLHNPTQMGIGYSKKRGCEAATGDIIAIVDGDDAITPNAFDAVLAAYQADFRRQFVYTTHLRCDENLENRKRMYWVKQYPMEGSLAFGTDTVSSMLTFKRSLYNQTEGYTEQQRAATDKHIVARFEELTLPHFVNEAPYLYRCYRTPTTVSVGAEYYAKTKAWALQRELGITFVIPYYDRLESVTRSIASIKNNVTEPCEIILSCWKDCDVADKNVRVLIDSDSPSFNRGRLLNRGGRAASYRKLFALDADVTIDRGFMIEYHNHVRYGHAWFPICRNTEQQPNTDNELFLKWGFGMVGITKRDAFYSGGWPEFGEWGAEDNLFYYQVQQTILQVSRSRYAGLVHYAHGSGDRHLDLAAKAARQARLAAGKKEFDTKCGRGI